MTGLIHAPAAPAWARPVAWGVALAGVLGLGIVIVRLTAGTAVPGLLAALISGMVLRPLLVAAPDQIGPVRTALEDAAKPLLRIGVALMGFRIVLADLQALGLAPVLIAVTATAAALATGYGLARLVGLSRTASWITAASVAICGAAAALAVAAVLARKDQAGADQSVASTVAAITVIGFAAAVGYPALATVLGWSAAWAGVFVGASVHEVAQVVAAGDALGAEGATTAMLVKMVRVAMLPFVVMGLSLLLISQDRKAARAQPDGPETGAPAPAAPGVPLFLVAFAVAAALSSAGVVPEPVRQGLIQASGWLLAGAMVAIGTQTSARGLFGQGPKPLLVLAGQTAIIASVAAAGVQLAHG